MKRVFAVVAVLGSLAACTGYAPGHLVAGQGIDEVTRQLGAPTGRHVLPQGGTRLEFARGPFGRHTYMVDLDPQGRVSGWRQVLTEAEFATIVPGMPQEDLLRRIGRPSEKRGGGWQPGEVWSYRYDAIFCQWFQVSVVNGQVRDAGYGPDPLCEVGKDDDRPT
jgi:hypothetical protein